MEIVRKMKGQLGPSLGFRYLEGPSISTEASEVKFTYGRGSSPIRRR